MFIVVRMSECFISRAKSPAQVQRGTARWRVFGLLQAGRLFIMHRTFMLLQHMAFLCLLDDPIYVFVKQKSVMRESFRRFRHRLM